MSAGELKSPPGVILKRIKSYGFEGVFSGFKVPDVDFVQVKIFTLLQVSVTIMGMAMHHSFNASVTGLFSRDNVISFPAPMGLNRVFLDKLDAPGFVGVK